MTKRYRIALLPGDGLLGLMQQLGVVP